MPFIPAPDVLQAELVYNWNAQIVETVLQFQCTTALTPTLMNQAGAFLVTWWKDVIDGYMSNSLSLIQVKLTDMTTQIAPVINYATGLPAAGTNASPTMPNNVACVITKRTLLRGRSFRGRIYHPGLCEAQVVANSVDGPTLTALITEYNKLIHFTTVGASWDMVVMSRYHDNAPRTTADSNQVTNLTSDGVVDSQRRRLPGRGG